jgi:hypothetical protein
MPEMRVLFRGHFACAHEVDKGNYEKDRRYHETTRRFLIAVSRIGEFNGRFLGFEFAAFSMLAIVRRSNAGLGQIVIEAA